MKRRGAIWLVVAVVAVAALLMYFVVLPQMRDGKTVEDIAKKAGQTVEDVKQAVNDAGKQVEEVAKGAEETKTVALAKMARLGADTTKAADEFQALLEKGTPTAEQLAAAKAKLAAALREASELKLPAEADSVVSAAAAKLGEGARAALAALDKLPSDPAAAKAAFADIKAGLLATLPGGASQVPADGAKPATTGDGAAITEPQAEEQKASVATEANKPAFDILRVEKDGSTVIAGRAEPGAKVEIVDGDKVIASAEVDPSGDFAAVLDNPLPSGDHSITLKATTKDGKTTASEEVATVSVPKDASGELLAMVTKPGEASKIITMPESKPADVASGNAVTADAKTSDAKTSDVETSAAKTAADGGQVELAIPDLPSTSTDIASTPPVVSQDAAGTTQEQQTAETDKSASEAAKATPAETADTQKAPAAAPEVLVSAVELEGDRIFVAGATKPGAAVRIYADDQVVADSVADDGGRFVAEGTIKLAVGNHTIRADVLSADGARVEFRASVPFFRPEGDLAAVASADSSPNAPSIEPLANGAFDKAREEAGKALALLKGLFADGRTPTAEELAAARSSAEIALKSLADVHVAADVDPAVADMAAKAIADAGKALDKLKAVPADVGAFKSALGEVQSIMGSVVTPAAEVASADGKSEIEAMPADAQKAAEGVDKSGQAVSADDMQVTTKVDRLASPEKSAAQNQESADAASTDAAQPNDGAAAATDKVASQDAAAADQPKVIEQAPLKQSEGSVIIRRGDTLWQISRRVYGKGVRYTTIYVANKSQIEDPDRIMPGQIFTMPGKWLENSEELHKEHLRHDHRRN